MNPGCRDCVWVFVHEHMGGGFPNIQCYYYNNILIDGKGVHAKLSIRELNHNMDCRNFESKTQRDEIRKKWKEKQMRKLMNSGCSSCKWWDIWDKNCSHPDNIGIEFGAFENKEYYKGDINILNAKRDCVNFEHRNIFKRRRNKNIVG